MAYTPMMTRDQIIAKLRELKPQLERDSHVATIAIFGSVARGDSTAGSDLDILVEFKEPPDIFAFLRLREYLSGALGTHVDLVTKRALRPALKAKILSEAIYA